MVDDNAASDGRHGDRDRFADPGGGTGDDPDLARGLAAHSNQ
jgi:hypothetical protein